MFEAGDDLGLALETQTELRVGVKHFGRQHFDRHLALEARIVAAIDGRHPPASQFGFDFVIADFFRLHCPSITIPKFARKRLGMASYVLRSAYFLTGFQL